MKSLQEQFMYAICKVAKIKYEIENNPNCDKELFETDLEMYLSISNSIESLKLKIETDYDYFVAVMHKNDYKRFVEYKEIDKRPRELLIKRYGNRKKAINRFKSHQNE